MFSNGTPKKTSKKRDAGRNSKSPQVIEDDPGKTRSYDIADPWSIRGSGKERALGRKMLSIFHSVACWNNPV